MSHITDPATTNRASAARSGARIARLAALALIGAATMALAAGCGSSDSGTATTGTRAAAAATPASVYVVASDVYGALYPWNRTDGQLFTCSTTGTAACTPIAAAGNGVTSVVALGTRVFVGSNDGTVRDCPGIGDPGAGGACRMAISPVDSVRTMAALPNGYLVLGRAGVLYQCTVRSGQGPVCGPGIPDVSAPVVVRGDTVYVTGGAHGEEIHTCSLSKPSAGCGTVLGKVPAAQGDFAGTVTGLAPVPGGVIVTSRDADKNPWVHACRPSSGCTSLKGLGNAYSAFAASSAGDVAYVGGGAGDGYIEGPGYVARCTLDGCTRLPREFAGRSGEGGIISALLATADGFIAGGVMQPVVWNCTASASCTRLGKVNVEDPVTSIKQLVAAG